MRVAAFDIGTNSVLLLIAERGVDGRVEALFERSTITRLGKGVDRSRSLAPDAIARTLECLRRDAQVADQFAVDGRVAVATSAVRDAGGAGAFLDAARQVIGVRPEVIDGPTEARLTHAGALAGLALQGPVGVFDVGGGSTEIVTELRDRQGVEVVSLDIGAVRMTERHIVSDPPSAQELAAIRADVRLHLAGAPRSLGPITWVGIGGTVTTLCAMDLAMTRYDGARVHGCPLRASAIREWVRKLSAMGMAERRVLPGLEPARADVILAGAVIVEELLGWAGVQSLTVSDRGVRWGLALRWFGTR